LKNKQKRVSKETEEPIEMQAKNSAEQKKKSFVEDAEEIYNENILKVNIIEKEVIDEKTKVKKVLVKKKIFYKDGTSQSVVYARNNK